MHEDACSGLERVVCLQSSESQVFSPHSSKECSQRRIALLLHGNSVHVQSTEFIAKSLTLITHVWLSPFLFSSEKIANGSRAGSRAILCVRAATAAAKRHATRFVRETFTLTSVPHGLRQMARGMHHAQQVAEGLIH